jgi:hypothetical protein
MAVRYATLQTELERKKEDLEAAFSLRVAKLQEDSAIRERERMRAQETYLNNPFLFFFSSPLIFSFPLP